jgi:acetyl-CoA synthetase
MNLGGIKVSSIEIEQLINTLDGIRETAAIAVPSPGGGLKRLVIYAVLLVHKRLEKNELKATFQAMIKQHLNPLFKIYDTIIIKSLPRTASNKIMRRILKNKYINEGQ